ncbi:MAG TPA: glycoside hydrolase family 5 protein [Ktedonobacteraceae bacterium]|nr:glycoside hydrolase family 5 protein [Ktedonobacteraceae bacterium]
MKKILVVLVVLLTVAIVAVAAFGVYIVVGQPGQPQATPTAIGQQGHHKHRTPTPGTDLTPTVFGSPVATGMPYVQGDQIIDGAGHPLILHGAQIESPFNYIQSWQSGKQPSQMLNSTVFNQMAQDWKMNVLRLPISNWIYAKDTANYMSKLDQVIQEANAAGLYVVLDLHDDAKSGSPYGDTADLPKSENISFWQAIASHYKNNPMVMYDPYNEPKARDWQTWLHGGGTVNGAKIVGFQDMVDAIRSTGSKQIIVVEPGSAGSSNSSNVNAAEEGGWATVGNNLINDPNIVYSLHVYEGILLTAQQQDAKWGPILNHHPIFYGEWALLTNGYGQSGVNHCKNVVHSQADQDVTAFLNYMASRHASWAAWQFEPHFLIQNYTSFAPSTLDTPWTCGDTTSYAGMGSIVKQFLTTGQ